MTSQQRDWHWGEEECRRGAAAYTEAIARLVPLQRYCPDCDAAFETYLPHQRLCYACLAHYAAQRQEARDDRTA